MVSKGEMWVLTRTASRSHIVKSGQAHIGLITAWRSHIKAYLRCNLEDGLILKGDRIVVPPTLRREILNIIHQGHLGQEKCLLRARTSVFWPGLTKDVINLVKECDPCQRHQRQQQKQPIMQPEPPNYPWQRLNSDLFEFKGHQYQLISDQYSKFPVIRKLTSTSSQAIVTHLKSIFAEHGIPAQLVTDNGPHYSAKEFQDFTESYGVEHITSSPHYPQANGSSERMVQTVENLLKKCDEEGGDPYLGLLSYRATPIDHHLKSPAELLTNRKFKTLLPMSNRASLTADSGNVKEQLRKRQEYYRHYYNQNAGPTLTPLHPGQPVRILDHQTKTWEPGTVLRAAKEPRSYIVKNNTTEGVYRRTRSHLRPDVTNPCTPRPPPVQEWILRHQCHHLRKRRHPQAPLVTHPKTVQSLDPLQGFCSTQGQVADT